LIDSLPIRPKNGYNYAEETEAALKQLQEVARLGSNVFEGLISTGELSAKDAFEVYTQKNAQIDYDAKKKELQNFYSE